MATINGIQLPPGIGASLGATSPEDAAKLFMKLVTSGMATVFADALRQALLDADGDGPPPDWTRLIKGCIVEFHWETPPGTQIQQCITVPSHNGLGGGDFSFAVKGDF